MKISLFSPSTIAGSMLLAASLMNTPAGPTITPAEGFSIAWDGVNGAFYEPAAPAPAHANIAIKDYGSAAFASSQLAFNNHFEFSANDGFYGNGNSWIPASGDLGPWIAVALPAAIPVRAIAWSRDNGNVSEGVFTDRSLGAYEIQITRVANVREAFETGDASTGWQSIGSVQYLTDADPIFNPSRRQRYQLSSGGQAILATGIRLMTPTGAAIDELEIESPIQRIAFGAEAPASAGLLTFTLAAKASSGLPVSYSVNGPAVLSGNTIKLTGNGVVVIKASQPGDGFSSAARDVTRTFISEAGALISRVVVTPAANSKIEWDGSNGLFANAAENAGPPDNLALASKGTVAFGTSSMTFGNHLIANLNDGQYGNDSSWIAENGDATPFVGLAFQSPTSIASIAWSRDNGNDVEGAFADRTAGIYTIQVTTAPGPSGTTAETGDMATGWITLGTVEYVDGPESASFSGNLRHQFSLGIGNAPLIVTGIRLKVNGQLAIDEIEVQGADSLPSVATPPASQFFAHKGSVTLSVQAAGAGNLYQWQRDGQNINGATGTTLTLANMNLTAAGAYRVIVSNPQGSVASAPANLTFFGDLQMYAGTTIAGALGQRFLVQYANNINGVAGDWQTLQEVTLTTSPMVVIDYESAGRRQRFYQAILIP